MKSKTTQIVRTDVLVIGGGGAGLRAAIEAREHGVDVVLVSESPVGLRNNTAISKATIAATGIRKEPGDSPELHLRDTIAGGRFINDRKMVETMTRQVKQQVYDLMKFGVNFKKQDGGIFVWQLPGHKYPRHVSGEAFRGTDFTRPMREYAVRAGIQLMEGVLVTKLLLAEDMVAGAVGVDDKGQVFVLNAKSVILATGGAGEVYLRTSNARGLTGDGYALAYEVGATLRDMEFIQFYPTAWGKHGSKICLYEKYIPKGAIIRNSLGEDILRRHGMDDFASVTRDKLTRTIMEEVFEGRGVEGSVVFDFTTMPEGEVQELYHDGLVRKGESPGKLQIAPAAHFFMGGVKVNEKGETGINGLYAAGEVCGGMHGTNRIGGNALAEAFVFGAIAGEAAAARASKMEQIPALQSEIRAEVERLTELTSGSRQGNVEQLKQSLKQTMWDKIGVIRDRKNLEEARREIVALREELRAVSLPDSRQLPQAIKLANMLTVSEMVRRAALTRTESRGAHYRADYPEEDNERWLKVIEICCQSGEMTLSITPIEDDG